MDLSNLFRRRRQIPIPPISKQAQKEAPEPTTYITDGGRRYLVGIPYLLPKDFTEDNRLEFQHHLLHAIIQGNYAAPIEKQEAMVILDVGCGTGRWVKEMAQSFPDAQITGFDIELPITSAPSNTRFVQGDLLQGLPFPDGYFDFIHQRLLVAAIPATHWPTVVQELKRVTRPEGWIELTEGGTTFINAGPATKQFLKWWDGMSKQRGIDASLMARLDILLRNAGLKQVKMRIQRVPIGWGGRAGVMLATNTHSGWSGLKDIFRTQVGVVSEQFNTTVAALPHEWESYHTEYEYFIAYGQR